MKKVLPILFFALYSFSAYSQEFNQLVVQTSDTLAKKIISFGKKKVAITDFLNIDESISQLGVFLSNEVSSELANLTDNQTKFRVLERANLDQIFKEKHIVSFSDPSGLAKELGKIEAADALLFATITDFDGFYRVVIKILDTKNGDALGSYKISFVKTPSLENLSKNIVKQSPKSKVQQEQSGAKTDKQELSGNQASYGDFCFRNIDESGYAASVSILKNGENLPLKTISVNYGETNCMYEIKSGIYTVIVSWSDSWSNNIPSTTLEIRVKAGLAGSLDIKHR